MAQTHTVEKLLVILKGSDFNATTNALQYLLSNINQARHNEIATCVEKLVRSPDISVRFWAKKLANGIGKYESERTNVQISTISKDLPIDILIQKLHSVASTYLSLDVIKKLCESRKPEALDFLKTYLSSCKDHIQTSYLTKNIGIFFPSEETLLFLVPFLKHNDDRVVANTIEGIEAINSPKGVVVLSQLLEHKSNRVRTNAALALGKFDSNTSFAVLSKMLEPESGAHFRISACHAIKTLKEPKFLELLELALHDDLTFTCALEAISAIGGQAAIIVLTDNYSEFSSEKQAKIDSVAIKLSKLEESSLGKFGEKIITSKACAKANVVIEEYGEKIHGKIKKITDTIMQFCRVIAAPTLLISVILVITYFWPEKSIQQPASTEKLTNVTPIEASHTEPKTISHVITSNNERVPDIKKNEKQASVQSQSSLEQPTGRKESIVQISASQRPEKNASIETFEPDDSVQDRYANAVLPSTTEENRIQNPSPRQVSHKPAIRRTQQQRASPSYENSISRQEQFQTNQIPTTNISWEEFNNTFFSSSQSELKKKKMWKQLKDCGVTWKGEVVEIREESFNSASILIKMNIDTLTYDIRLYLESNQADKAADLDKGQEIQFYGVLSKLGGLILPTELKKGKILE